MQERGSLCGLVLLVCLTGSLTCILAGCGTGALNGSKPGSGPAETNPSTSVPTGYLTWKNDRLRTGLQSNETILTPANVNPAQFGEKFSYPLDAWTYAQPLYVAGLTIGGAKHNVVFVATEHDSVYAFDADSPGPPLWQISFLGPGTTTVPSVATKDRFLAPNGIGITSTPVIDPNSGTLYVLAQTVENGVYANKLHALDLASGADKPGSPIALSAAGFQAKQEFQRSALLLANGNIYVAFASYAGDRLPYNGWVFAVDAASLRQIASWNATASGSQGGIWMAGTGPAADEDGNLYVATGNGTWNGTTDFGMSVIKLDSTLHVLDYFTPFNVFALSEADYDLASGGVLLVPHQSGIFPNEAIICGKPDSVYVLNRDSMGHKGSSDDTQIIQSLPHQVGGIGRVHADHHCFTTAAYFNHKIYFVGNNDVIKAFTLNWRTGQLSSAPVSHGSFVFAFPGAQPVVSSNGTADGIVWAVDHGPAASLHAFDANDVSRELYRSPSIGDGIKWAVPTVINGKVYVATQSRLVVFGLK